MESDENAAGRPSTDVMDVVEGAGNSNDRVEGILTVGSSVEDEVLPRPQLEVSEVTQCPHEHETMAAVPGHDVAVVAEMEGMEGVAAAGSSSSERGSGTSRQLDFEHRLLRVAALFGTVLDEECWA